MWEQIQVLEELSVLGVVVGHETDVDEVQEILCVVSGQDDVFYVFELVQECLWGHVVHLLQVAFVVHDNEVLHRPVVEHVFVGLDEVVEPFAVRTHHAEWLHDGDLKVPFNCHVLLDYFLVLQFFKVFRKLEFATGSRFHKVPKERMQEFTFVNGNTQIEIVEFIQDPVQDLNPEWFKLFSHIVIEVGNEAADFVVDLVVTRGEVDDA